MFFVLVKQIYTKKSVQHKWHIQLWWTFSDKNNSLFISTHFWWKHSSQTEEHAINILLSFSGSLSSKFQRYLQNTSIFVMYDFHLFERFVIFGNGLQWFCGKFVFFQVSSHHIRFIGCNFCFFFIKNTICFECDWKYLTVNVDWLMLYMHIFY